MNELTSETFQEKLTDVNTLEDLLERVLTYHPNAPVEKIKLAYELSEKAHTGQFRRSGEPYIFHPLAVAGILADLKLDASSVITGILHDTVEDTHVTLDEIKEKFGEDVAHLVDGVTKISRMSFRNSHEKQGENIRKMIVAMGKDVRVVLVKLADRLHNMRTLNHMPPGKQTIIAQETLDIYAPLANRLGINEWKIELEDLSLRYLKPDIYYDLAQKVIRKKKEREKYIDKVKGILIQQMQKAKIKCDIQGRPKHLYSIYKKMAAKNLVYEQVYDVLAFRILVESLAQCYEALGIVHSLYKPVPGRFKDFIAMAKPNNYQSLHTTIIGPDAERIEIQIRTYGMHLVAERGIAAHWKYKEGYKADDSTEKAFSWLRDLVSSHQQVNDATEFLETLKGDLFDAETYVFTPKGEVKVLPDGATPIDFAYSIHTDVGHRVVGAKVDGRMVPLRYKLRNGETIEIITGPKQSPSKDWLNFCVTSRAQSKIRAFIRSNERDRAEILGKDLFDKELRRFHFAPNKFYKETDFSKFFKNQGIRTIEDMFVHIGYGKLLPGKALELIVPNLRQDSSEPKDEKTTFLGKVIKSAIQRSEKSRSAILVDGMNDMLVRYAKCCSPIPGDPIVGFISRGRGVTIHRTNCPKAFELDTERRIDVKWSTRSDNIRTSRLRVVSLDTPGLLQSMSECFTQNGININNAQIRTNKDHKAISLFDVSVKDISQMTKVIADLQKIRGVLSVDRI